MSGVASGWASCQTNRQKGVNTYTSASEPNGSDPSARHKAPTMRAAHERRGALHSFHTLHFHPNGVCHAAVQMGLRPDVIRQSDARKRRASCALLQRAECCLSRTALDTSLSRTAVCHYAPPAMPLSYDSGQATWSWQCHQRGAETPTIRNTDTRRANV